MAGLSTAMPYVGAALFAASALGLFGDDEEEPPPGHRRENWARLEGGPGGYRIGSSEVPDPQVITQLAASLNAALNDPAKYDQGRLASMVGSTFGGPAGTGSQDLVSGLLSQISGADIGGQVAMRETLRIAADPLKYWNEQVNQLTGDLHTSARTVEDWRKQFLSALDQTITAEDFAKWQKLGAAIEQASGLAGSAARVVSMRGFATRPDYRRELLSGGGANSTDAGVQEELRMMRAELRAIAASSHRTAKILDRVEGPNGGLLTEAAA